MAVIWNTSFKKYILWARESRLMFFNCYYISFQDMRSFFEFLLSVINHYHINALHLFWDSSEWFCLQINIISSIAICCFHAYWDTLYLPLGESGIIGSIVFPRLLALCKTQKSPFRIRIGWPSLISTFLHPPPPPSLSLCPHRLGA